MKFICTTFSILLTVSIYAQINLEEGLVAYYPFNHSLQDESSFGNHAVSSNQILFAIDEINGVTDTVASFNGMNSYVEIPHANQINFGNNDVFSIALWIKIPPTQTDNQGAVNDIMSKWSNSGSQPYPFTLRIRNQASVIEGTVSAGIYEGNSPLCSASGTGLASISRINDNQWHHIVFTRTEQNLLQLYIDCNLEQELMDPSICSTSNLATMLIGMRDPDPLSLSPRALEGSLDDLRIYDRELTMDEKNALCGITTNSTNYVEINESPISIFPNPILAGQPLNIHAKRGSAPIKTVMLYSSAGELLKTYEQLDSIYIPSAGVYFVRIQLNDDSSFFRKIVIINRA